MVACLLLLGAGVTAATSAFLARQDLQNACDGAAAAAADADRAGYYLGAPDPGATPGPAAQAARDYLAERNPQVRVDAVVLAESVQLTCSGSADITFGALFGAGHLTQSVQAVGHPVL